MVGKRVEQSRVQREKAFGCGVFVSDVAGMVLIFGTCNESAISGEYKQTVSRPALVEKLCLLPDLSRLP